MEKGSVLAVLNSIRKTSQIPVLMLTAMEDEQTQVASFDRQADDYMTKPFSMVILGKRRGIGFVPDATGRFFCTWK